MDSPQLVEVSNMQWLVPSLIGIGLFLLGQTGALIWFLSAMKSDVGHIRRAVEKWEARVADQEERLDNLDGRVTELEVTCRETHKRRR